VIQSFADRDTGRLFARERVSRRPGGLHRALLKKLVMLDAAEQLEDLRVPPGNRLEMWVATGQGNMAFASTTNGACASVGRAAARTMWRSST